MTIGTRKTHEFCWINLMTTEAAHAKAFYAKLFGWTYGEMPGVTGGHLIEVKGRAAGALMDLATAKMPPGTPAVIGALVKVEDVDATMAKLTSLGGRGEAFDAMDNGRLAVCTDPNGATFGLWQPKTKPGFDVDSRAHGAPTWFETITTDLPRAVAFYTALFGWRAEDQHPVPGMTYTLFKLGAEPVAGAMAIQPRMEGATPHWGTSFAVDDADATVKLAGELGATICMPVHEIPSVGRFAVVQSPQGVVFSVMQWS